MWYPMAQSMHAAEDSSPAFGLNVPGGHMMHSGMASLSPY